MKIELIKETKIDRKIWFKTYVDGSIDNAYLDEHEANERYDYLVAFAITGPKREVIKSTEI
jgi:hypothetical protein